MLSVVAHIYEEGGAAPLRFTKYVYNTGGRSYACSYYTYFKLIENIIVLPPTLIF